MSTYELSIIDQKVLSRTSLRLYLVMGEHSIETIIEHRHAGFTFCKTISLPTNQGTPEGPEIGTRAFDKAHSIVSCFLFGNYLESYFEKT